MSDCILTVAQQWEALGDMLMVAIIATMPITLLICMAARLKTGRW